MINEKMSNESQRPTLRNGVVMPRFNKRKTEDGGYVAEGLALQRGGYCAKLRL